MREERRERREDKEPGEDKRQRERGRIENVSRGGKKINRRGLWMTAQNGDGSGEGWVYKRSGGGKRSRKRQWEGERGK